MFYENVLVLFEVSKAGLQMLSARSQLIVIGLVLGAPVCWVFYHGR